MSNRYSKQHYEDVAKIIFRLELTPQMIGRVALDFADLFASDNPPACHCGATIGSQHPCNTGSGGHVIAGGFDRERFLASCGLEFGPKPTIPKQILRHYGLPVVEPELECPNCGQTTHTIGECV